jgi:hypothetical protein
MKKGIPFQRVRGVVITQHFCPPLMLRHFNEKSARALHLRETCSIEHLTEAPYLFHVCAAHVMHYLLNYSPRRKYMEFQPQPRYNFIILMCCCVSNNYYTTLGAEHVDGDAMRAFIILRALMTISSRKNSN